MGDRGKTVVVTFLYHPIFVDPYTKPQQRILTKRQARDLLAKTGKADLVDSAMGLPGDSYKREVALQQDERQDFTRPGEW